MGFSINYVFQVIPNVNPIFTISKEWKIGLNDCRSYITTYIQGTKSLHKIFCRQASRAVSWLQDQCMMSVSTIEYVKMIKFTNIYFNLKQDNFSVVCKPKHLFSCCIAREESVFVDHVYYSVQKFCLNTICFIRFVFKNIILSVFQNVKLNIYKWS